MKDVTDLMRMVSTTGPEPLSTGLVTLQAVFPSDVLHIP